MPHERNPGIPLDLQFIESAVVDRPALDARAATLQTRRSVKMKWQIAWLLRSIQCMDLTTLSGDDTPGKVAKLCAKARHPIPTEVLDALRDQLGSRVIQCGAVCVYPNLVKEAVKRLEGSGIPVASVATGFPAGQTPLGLRLEEIRLAVADGAKEIDIVIPRAAVLTGNWQQLYDEVVAMRKACGEAHLKTILATGELSTYRQVYQASWVCMMAGADFIKTSTGKEPVNATIQVGLVMCRAIREYYERTGFKVGFKPAGGIRLAKEALVWLSLMKEELGDDWTKPDLFRLGVSALLLDVERQLVHGITGRYAGNHYFAYS
jgi:deoxyribose-phosphate aldolase